jgi:hypothetical protein
MSVRSWTTPTILVMLLAVLASSLTATAVAAGPPVVGGEDHMTYLDNHGFELRMLPQARVTWVSNRTFWNCPDQRRYSRTKYFIADHSTVDSLRRLRARNSYDKARWELRFSADWTTVTGTFRAARGGCKTRALRISARRRMPAQTWQFGTFTGTTSQGLPISLVSSYAVRYGSIETFVKLVTVTVRLSCTDGSTTETTLHSFGEARAVSGGSFTPELTPTGRRLQSYIPEQGAEDFGAIQGAKLSGPQAVGEVVAQNPSNSCRTDPEGRQPVTFIATAH